MIQGQTDISPKSKKEFDAAIAAMSASHKEEVDSLHQEINKLKAQVAYLNRQLFGRKSEKLPVYDPNQLYLFEDQFADNMQQAQEQRDEAVETIQKETKAERKQKRENRKMLEDLPVLKRTIIEPDNIDLSLYKEIGREVTRIVESEPGKLYIHELIRPKYGLKDNISLPPEGHKGVEIAPMPLLPIDKCIAGASLLAEILLQKYEYHMPFYRQIKQFAQLGMKGLKENTVDGWFKKSVELLRPLYLALVEEVMKSDYCQADETTIPVINKDSHKAAKEYLWMVRSVMEKLVIFHYDEGSRAGAVIESLAKKYNFKGYMQCDGFAGYETAFKTNPNVVLVNCLVHIRRSYEQALGENKAMAEHALTEIQHIYQVDKICDEKKLTAEERLQKRNELMRPIMEAMKVWMETEGIKYSPSSLIGKAITYAYTRWDNMMNCLKDGRLKLDNNLAEGEVRPITLGRKNYLFCGNHEAAGNMAVVCSLLATCRNHDVNPRHYLNDVIARMPYMKKASHEELVEMLPHKWVLTHPESKMTKLREEV